MEPFLSTILPLLRPFYRVAHLKRESNNLDLYSKGFDSARHPILTLKSASCYFVTKEKDFSGGY